MSKNNVLSYSEQRAREVTLLTRELLQKLPLVCADFLRAMQSLGFSVGDVIVLLQSFNESEEEIKHADSGM